MLKSNRMLAKAELAVVSNFALDGAKIIFGSLVVGTFIPAASGKIAWLSFVIGIAMTSGFLIAAMKLSKIAEIK